MIITRMIKHGISFWQVGFIITILSICFIYKANANADTVTDEAIQLQYGPETVMATMKKRDGKDLEYKYKDFSVAEKLGKFMEDVK